MNFKIDYNYLDITNTPQIEQLFEERAREGWMIQRIVFGFIFIYQKIEPADFEFSISPYEIETTFTRKTKSEIQEFQEVSKQVGWHYATKTYDLHVYYKGKATEAIPLQTDEVEEFNLLKGLAKDRIKSYRYQLIILVALFLFTPGGIAHSVSTTKSGASQIIAPLFPVVIVLAVWGIIHLKRFIQTNEENIELGQPLEYSTSQFLVPKIAFGLTLFVVFVLILYALYSIFILKNRFMLVFLLPVGIGLAVGNLFRFFVKPAKISLGYKQIALGVGLLTAFILAAGTGMLNLTGEDTTTDAPNLTGYKVLTVDDFSNDTLEDSGSLDRQASILVPESYTYSYFSQEEDLVLTEYANALTERSAKNLMTYYINQAENALTGRYSQEVELYLDDDIFPDYLLGSGLTEEDLMPLKDLNQREAEKVARELIHERSIVAADEDSWGADEGYFLTYEKDELLLRDGKEVFYFSGKDFSDPTVIEVVKNKIN